MEEVDDSLRRYGRQVREAVVGEDNVLKLPEGFLGEPEPAELWVHPNYVLLEDFLVRRTTVPVCGRMPRKAKRQFHLVATPGIGKTFFGHYWFYRQAKEKKRVIWRTRAGLFLYYDFSLEDPLVHAFEKYVGQIWGEAMKTIWLVVDGKCKVIPHRGFVLQCVCPARDGYHEFAKDVGVVCHLEAWNLDELMDCRDKLELEFTDAQLAERFYYCGGVPREVFDDTKTTEDLKYLMVQVVDRTPDLEAVIGQARHDTDISDYLLHYQLQRPEPNLNRPASDCVLRYRLKFASDFVEDLVVDRYRHEKVREFFNSCQEISVAHGLCGKFFERYVHRTLREGGGQYKVRDLVIPGDAVSTITLKPSSTKRLRRWEVAKDAAELGKGKAKRPSKDERMRGELEVRFKVYDHEVASYKEEAMGLASLDKGCFVQPYSATFKSLDSFIVADTMIQVTYSLVHKLFWAPVLEIVQEFDRWYMSRDVAPPAYYKLFFVVPESQFRDFKFQGYKKEDGSDYVELQPEMSRVRQFVLSFP